MSRWKDAARAFWIVQIVVGMADACAYVVGEGLPHPVFPLLALGIYGLLGAAGGALVGLGALALPARHASGFGLAASALVSGFAALFLRWLPESVEIGTPLGLSIAGLLGLFCVGLAVTAPRWFGPRSRRAAVTLALITAPLLALRGVGGGSPFDLVPEVGAGRSPDLLLISLDTLRADHVGPRDDGSSLTPNLDALAATGTRFSRALSTSNFTPPPHASMLTGTYPSRHGVQDGQRFLSDANRTLPEFLAPHGYANFAVISNLSLSRVFGWDQGFHLYDDALVSGSSAGVWLERTPAVALLAKARLTPRRWLMIAAHRAGIMEPAVAASTVDHVLDAVDRAGDRPFFGFVNFMDPHFPYGPPTLGAPGSAAVAEAARVNSVLQGTLRAEGHRLSAADRGVLDQVEALYEAEVRYLDSELGRLFEELERRGRWGNALVAVTADHGEHLGDHQRLFHANSLYRQLVHVPMIVRLPRQWPGAVAGAEVAELVSVLDLTGTFLEVAGAPAPPTLHGGSLLPALTGADSLWPGRTVASEWANQVTLEWDELKAFFLDGELVRVVSTARDSTESIDDADWADEAIERYRQWVIDHVAPGSLMEGGHTVAEEMREKLEALGYLN